MKKGAQFLFGLILASSFSFSTFAQVSSSALDTSDRTADHDALRVMLIEAEKAMNEGRFDDLTKYFDPNVNAVYLNGEVADGIIEINNFKERILNKNNGILKSFTTKVTADKLTEFYGNTAIAYGTVIDHYVFVAGLEMDVTSKWTATLIKNNGVWKVVSFTYTGNLFDNPLLTNAKMSATYFGFGGLVLGILMTFFAGRFFRKKK